MSQREDIQAVMDTLETFDEDNSVDETYDLTKEHPFDDIDSPRRPFDLSNDVRVNELAAANGRQPNPDSEWIHNLEDDLRVNAIAEERGWTPHPDSETIEVNEFPREREDLLELLEDPLENDLRVNSVAEKSNWPLHPDVEIIDFGNDIEGPETRYRYDSNR